MDLDDDIDVAVNDLLLQLFGTPDNITLVLTHRGLFTSYWFYYFTIRW